MYTKRLSEFSFQPTTQNWSLHLIKWRFTDAEQDNSARKIWEWVDLAMTPEQVTMLSAIAHAREVLIRYHGSQYQKDREMSSEEKFRLHIVLAAHDIMNREAQKP